MVREYRGEVFASRSQMFAARRAHSSWEWGLFGLLIEKRGDAPPVRSERFDWASTQASGLCESYHAHQ